MGGKGHGREKGKDPHAAYSSLKSHYSFCKCNISYFEFKRPKGGEDYEKHKTLQVYFLSPTVSVRILILSPSCNASLKSHSYKSFTSTVVICWNIVRMLDVTGHRISALLLVNAISSNTMWRYHQTTGRPRHSTTQQRVANITDEAQMDKFFESWSYIHFFQVSFSRNTLLATCLMSLTSYCSC